jgi:single-strand DNA-binding protein
MSDIARATISGRFTRDPELRHTAGGTSVMNARLAFESGRKVNGEWVNEPNYIDVTAFGNRAEFYASRLEKGSLVFVEGRLKWSEWETQDGSKRQKIEVLVDEIKSPDLFKTGGRDQSGGSGSDRFVPSGSSGSDFSGADDDIPF